MAHLFLYVPGDIVRQSNIFLDRKRPLPLPVALISFLIKLDIYTSITISIRRVAFCHLAVNGVFMAQSVKLADDVMSVVRRESGLQSRSVAGQITHWINIGRAIEKSSAFDYQHINAALTADLSPDALSAEEQEVWFVQFADDVTDPTDHEKAFYAQRRQLGRGVGLNDKGDLIYQEAAKQ